LRKLSREILLAKSKGEAPASPSSIEALKAALPFALPADYAQFLLQANGGEGHVGESFLRLWSVEELLERQLPAEIAEYVPGLFLVGSNGGGEAYALDFRSSLLRYVMTPFIVPEWEYAYEIADDFDGFLLALYWDARWG
jgi:hypothetical protein